MRRRPPKSTRTDTLLPDTTLCRSEEMKKPGSDWENLDFGAGADKMILSGFKNEALKPLTGKTLAEVAAMRGKSPEETAMDLVVEDGDRKSTRLNSSH